MQWGGHRWSNVGMKRAKNVVGGGKSGFLELQVGGGMGINLKHMNT